MGQEAFALAALGRRRASTQKAFATARRFPAERRIYAALAVASGLISAERVLAIANRFGRSI